MKTDRIVKEGGRRVRLVVAEIVGEPLENGVRSRVTFTGRLDGEKGFLREARIVAVSGAEPDKPTTALMRCEPPRPEGLRVHDPPQRVRRLDESPEADRRNRHV